MLLLTVVKKVVEINNSNINSC